VGIGDRMLTRAWSVWYPTPAFPYAEAAASVSCSSPHSLPLLTARLLRLPFCLCPLPLSLVPAFVLVLSPPIRRRRWPSEAATGAGNQPRGRP